MTKRLTITKKGAISECKKLWKEIEEHGRGKYNFLFHTPDGEKWADKDYRSSCPLCEYAHQLAKSSEASCHNCPLWKQYGKYCWHFNYKSGTPEWYEAVRGLK